MGKKTAMARSTKVLEFVPSPTVTIIPPWKEHFEGGFDVIPAINCTNTHNASEEVWNCILDQTYNISEVIINESHGGKWRTELTDPRTGIYWSREDFFNLSTSKQESYDIYINENISTTNLVLYDPHFFAINVNPMTIPKVLQEGKKGEGWYFQLHLKVTEISKINLPSSPCEASFSHSLTKCIKEFVIKVCFIQL